jgi:hypothetical protein
MKENKKTHDLHMEIDSEGCLRSIGSVASLLAATLYQGNHDMNHKYGEIGSIKTYILHIQVLLESNCAHLLAELFLYSLEADFIQGSLKTFSRPAI